MVKSFRFSASCDGGFRLLNFGYHKTPGRKGDDMPRGILFIGGRGPDSRQVSSILRDDDIICAADSGLDAALNAGIRPGRYRW